MTDCLTDAPESSDAAWRSRPRGAHVTVWPNDSRHSSHRRPSVYRGIDTRVWWVDDSGVNPKAWGDQWESWDQTGFDSWSEALGYALKQVAAFAGSDPHRATDRAVASEPPESETTRPVTLSGEE